MQVDISVIKTKMSTKGSITGMSKFLNDVMAALRSGVSLYGSARKLAIAANMNPSTLTKWLTDKENQAHRSPNIREVGPIMDLLGVSVVIDSGGGDGKLNKEMAALRKENAELRRKLEIEEAVSARLQDTLSYRNKPIDAQPGNIRQNKNCA